jgi:starvation-inducible DNA-binding protein
MKPNIGLADKTLKSVTEILTAVLADGVVLYTKTRKYHWNMSGPSFMELHKLLEDHYEKLAVATDEVAERINKLGSPAIGTLAEFLENASLKESPGKLPPPEGMLKELLSDHEAVIKQLRKHIDACTDDLKDAGTADFLTALMIAHETLAWNLRRYLS